MFKKGDPVIVRKVTPNLPEEFLDENATVLGYHLGQVKLRFNDGLELFTDPDDVMLDPDGFL